MDATLLLSADAAALAARRCPSTPARRPGQVAPGRRPASCRSVRARAAAAAAPAAGSVAGQSNGVYTVGDFMTRRENLHVVKPTTSVDKALEMLVQHRISGFPVVDDNGKLVGLVSDYDLLALDSVSGNGLADTNTNMFPDVDSTWKTFREIQILLSKTNGKVIGDVMTSSPIAVRENTNLDAATRLLLETKYRRLPVVDSTGKLVSGSILACKSCWFALAQQNISYIFLSVNIIKFPFLKVGMITRGNVVRAALKIKKKSEEDA
ncbi:unnamed protein product [Urochloa decumbens]|uniref:CBS domain-containing protein n=1 Tax=Urochloa decumbens TaxID=240449 RepID=A0ABC9EYL6_9POAL